MAADFEAEGLLEGLDGPAREARLELLQKLSDDGVELEELKQATEEARLPLVPVERILMGGGERYTSTEIAEKTELDRAFLERLWRRLGMAVAGPDERVFTDADLEAAKRVKTLKSLGMADEDILELGRVMARGMFAVASSVARVFSDTYLEAGDDEQTLAMRYAEASRELVPLLGPILEHVLNVQQRAQIRQAAVDSSALEEGRLAGAEEVTICFADLVGFTRLGENVDSLALGAVAERLEDLAGEIAEPPVRLIKTIGDAVMLESRDTDALVEAALQLVESAENQAEDFPELCAGLARGEALERAGDWYGRPVNLASRITGVARPGSVLADASVKEDSEGPYRWSFAGKRKLKGVPGEVELHRARRAGAEDEE